VSFPRALIDAANYGFRFRPLFEALAIALVMISTTAIAVHEFTNLVARAQLIESAALMSTNKVSLMVFHAQHGRWPETDDEIAFIEAYNDHFRAYRDTPGKYVDALIVGDAGQVAVTFNDERSSPLIGSLTLAYRPFTNAHDATSPIVWGCGYAVPPPGMTVLGDNPTNISPFLLPYSCRTREPE